MDTELTERLKDESITLDSKTLAKVMENLKLSYRSKDWDVVLDWRELIYHKLDIHRYWFEAVKVNEWAIEAATHQDRIHLIARFTHDLADIKSQQGYYKDAEALYKRSFKIYDYEVHDHSSATKSLHMLSLARRALGNNADAKNLALKCLQRAERFNMGAWRAHPLHLLAWVSRDEGNYDEAIQYLTKALEIHQETQEHDREAMLSQTHYDIARTLLMAGKTSNVEMHIDEAIKWSSISGIQRIGYVATKLYGDMAFVSGMNLRAREYYHQALDHAQTGPDERRVGEIYLDLAKAYWQLGQPRKAFGYFYSGISQLRRLGLLSFSRFQKTIIRWLKSRTR